MERLKAIAEKHSNSLQDIKTQLEPARKQWADDIKKLQPAKDDAKADDSYYGQRHMEHGPASFLYGHRSAAFFLLLPTTLNDQTQNELKADFLGTEPATTTTPAVNFVSFEVMPNPASNDIQLGTDILPATNQLKITDLQGKEVMSLENVQASQHLDVSQLASDTYLIQVKSGDLVVTKKIVINR